MMSMSLGGQGGRYTIIRLGNAELLTFFELILKFLNENDGNEVYVSRLPSAKYVGNVPCRSCKCCGIMFAIVSRFAWIMADNNGAGAAQAAQNMEPAAAPPEGNQDKVIQDTTLVGNSISEELMKSLVSRGSGAEALAETCRAHGYTTGAAFGSLLTIDNASGEVRGAGFAAIAEAGAPVMEFDVNIKKIWANAADRQQNVHFKIMAGDLIFSSDASGKAGMRAFTDWVDAASSDSFTTPGVDKSEWASMDGLKDGACWKLCIEPQSPEMAKIRVLVAPVSKEELTRMTNDNGTAMDDPAMPVISMVNNLKMRFFPTQKQGTQSAGLGFLPLLYYNTADQDLKLPTLGEVKKEHFDLLRDIVKPPLSKSAEWHRDFAEHWQEPRGPTLIWPLPPPAPTQPAGEYPFAYFVGNLRDICT